jgi:hypothetical protein
MNQCIPMPPSQPESAPRLAGESSPFLTEFFLVQTEYFRCMAYRDQAGVWREAFNHEELTGEICIVE